MDLRDASASKNYVADFCYYIRYFGHEFQKKLQHNFPKMRGGGQRPFGTFPKIHPLWKGSASLMPVYTVHLYLSLSFLCLHSACVFTCDFVHVCENLTYAIFTVRLVPMLGVLYLHHPRMLENAFQRNFFFNFHSFIFW